MAILAALPANRKLSQRSAAPSLTPAVTWPNAGKAEEFLSAAVGGSERGRAFGGDGEGALEGDAGAAEGAFLEEAAD
jgi:hypothetical protein